MKIICEETLVPGHKRGLPYFSSLEEEKIALKALYMMHSRIRIRKYPIIFFYGLHKPHSTVSVNLKDPNTALSYIHFFLQVEPYALSIIQYGY